MPLTPEPYTTTQDHVSACLSESAALYRVYFFGPFRVFHDDQPLGEPVWRRNKAKALMKWFLLNLGNRYSADQLAEMFWPNTLRETGIRNLHATIHYLRRLLEPTLFPHQESRYLRRNRNHFYWFEPDSIWWTDILDIHHLYTAAKELDHGEHYNQAIFSYCNIVSYCRLGFLPEDIYEDIFDPFRCQYDQIYAHVLERLIYLYFRLAMFDEVLTYSHLALSLNPYCESAVQAIATVYLQQGHALKALRTLNDFQDFLKQELGIEPNNEILILRKKIAALA